MTEKGLDWEKIWESLRRRVVGSWWAFTGAMGSHIPGSPQRWCSEVVFSFFMAITFSCFGIASCLLFSYFLSFVPLLPTTSNRSPFSCSVLPCCPGCLTMRVGDCNFCSSSWQRLANITLWIRAEVLNRNLRITNVAKERLSLETKHAALVQVCFRPNYKKGIVPSFKVLNA